jgi:hypothetical protein
MTTPSTASHLNAAAITPEFTVRSIYTGAGAAAMTKVRGKGMVSPGNTRQGVGLYTLQVVDGGAQVMDVKGVTHTAATVSPQLWKFVPGSYVRSTPTSPATVQVECWNVVAPALADPPAASLVALEITFAENIVD